MTIEAARARTAGADIRTRIIESVSDFAGLEPEWNDLLDRCRSRSVFLTWGWLYSWWSQFAADRRLMILVVRDTADRLLGIAPFCVRRSGGVIPLRTVSFLGTERVSSEYLDVIADPVREADVLRVIWNGLLEASSSWDCLHLTDLLEDSLLLTHWKLLARERGVSLHETESQACPFLALPSNIEEFRRGLGSRTRANFRRAERTLDRHGISFEVIHTPSELLPGLETLYDLHGRRWATRNRAGNLADEPIREFHRQVSRRLGPRSFVRLYVLRLADRTLACLYAFEYKKRLIYYQSGFNPEPPVDGIQPSDYSPGFLLVGRCIEDGIRRGLEEFDFLRGDEAYKRLWTRSRRQTRTILVIPPRAWRAHTLHAARSAFVASKGAIKRILGRAT